jgi:hypothetical protein
LLLVRPSGRPFAGKALASAHPSSPKPQPSAQASSGQLPSSVPEPSGEPGSGKGKNGKATIIFTFDDGDVSDYLLAYPILKQYDIKGTSYIIAGFIDRGVPEKLTWPQVKEMVAYGWDFGGHTYDHCKLKELTDDQIKENLENVNASFEKQGLPDPQVMAYPYGSFDQRVIDDIKPFYKQARLAFYETKFVDLKHVDPYRIDSISADMGSPARLKSVEDTVDKACEEGAVCVFRVHAMYKDKIYDTVCQDKPLPSGSGPQTDSKLFEQLVKYCVDKGCDFKTMTQLMGLYS